MASAANTIQHLAELLADALQQVERDFSSTTRSWNHAGNDVALDAAQVLGLIETGAPELLRSDASEDVKALAVLRITDDLRRIARLTEDVASLPHPVSGVAQDLIDHLRRMTDLTAAQPGGQGVLPARPRAGPVQRVLLAESAPDNWYDLLLVDVLDDLDDGRDTRTKLPDAADGVSALERIGDHARHISECTLAIARAHAAPSAVAA